jgi:hypothetical protein
MGLCRASCRGAGDLARLERNLAAGELGGRGELGEGGFSARSAERATGLPPADACPTGVAYRPSVGDYEVRFPGIAADLNQGSLGHA